VATIILSHNSSLQQVAHILGLLVQDGLSRPVALDGLEPLRSLHLPGYDECPSLYTHTACSKCKQMFNEPQRHTCCALHDVLVLECDSAARNQMLALTVQDQWEKLWIYY